MKRSVPIIRKTDVLLVGGSLAGCKKAVALKKQGLAVYAVTPYSAWGDDRWATLDLPAGYTPAQLKAELDRAFIDVGIDYLFETAPVRISRDAAGRINGVLLATRSGFAFVACRLVIDATYAYTVSALAGAAMPDRSGDRAGVLRMLGGCADSDAELSSGPGGAKLYTVRGVVSCGAGTPQELAGAGIAFKLATWSPETTVLADRVEIDLGQRPAAPAGVAYPDSVPEKLPIPGAEYRFAGAPVDRHGAEVVRRDTFDAWQGCETVEFDLDTLPDFAACQVLVAGAGTAGAAAAIAAGRDGMKVICVEKLNVAGGVCTAGMISSYWFGNRVGFTAEMDRGVYRMGPRPDYDPATGANNNQWKRQWLLREMAVSAGVTILPETLLIGAVVKAGRVCGAAVAGPFGVGVISAQATVDATGNADLAAAAGAETVPAVTDEPAVQGAGVSPVPLGKSYCNSDYSFVWDSDVLDSTRMYTMAHAKFAGEFDVAQMLGTRERRRIVGDLTLTPPDFFAHRTYNDTITVAMSNFDTHGFILHPMFLLKPTAHAPYYANVPFRALLPRKLDGVIVTGLAVSAHRDCMPLIRMQPDVQNQGYAAGMIAAASVFNSVAPYRQLDIRSIQGELVESGILPQSVLAGTDAPGTVDAADPHCHVAVDFRDPKAAREREAARYRVHPTLDGAQELAFLGDAAGRELLSAAVARRDWDKGWCYTGMGQFGPSASPLDVLLFALSAAGGDADVVLDKLNRLRADMEFSHFRAVAMALLRHPDSRAASRLEALLAEPGMTGYAVRSLREAVDSNRPERNDTSFRNGQLKEIYLARALAACDPASATAKRILAAYAGSAQTLFRAFAGA